MSMAETARKGLRTKVKARATLGAAAILAASLLYASHRGVSQTAGVNQGGPDYIHSPAGLNPMPQHNGSASGSTMDQMRRAERRKRLAEDTTKLVDLSNQLKAEVERTPEDQIAVGITKKAADIEKLARDVRQWQNY